MKHLKRTPHSGFRRAAFAAALALVFALGFALGFALAFAFARLAAARAFAFGFAALALRRCGFGPEGAVSIQWQL